MPKLGKIARDQRQVAPRHSGGECRLSMIESCSECVPRQTCAISGAADDLVDVDVVEEGHALAADIDRVAERPEAGSLGLVHEASGVAQLSSSLRSSMMCSTG
jgi:hypothetical protein